MEVVVAKVCFVGEQLGHLHLAEPIRQGIVLHVPVVDELPCAVVARAVFTVCSYFQCGFEVPEVEGVLLVDVGRYDVFIELRIFAVDFVTGSEHHRALL